MAGVFIAADDQTVVVTVLPEIMLDLKVQINELDRASWTITGYLLGYVAAMPIIGRLSDVWGRRRLFVASMLLFMAGSVLVALSPSLWLLVGARVFQAVGAGALLPVSIAIVGDLFPAERRGGPMGFLGGAAEAGGVVGPLWGGILIRYLDWPWVFWMNIPLGAVVVVGVLVLLKDGPRRRAPVDYVGGGLIAASLATLTLGLARIGSPDLAMAAYLLASAASLALFVARQRNAPAPLLPLSMFRSWMFSAANATHLLVGGALIIAMVTVPLMTDTVLGQAPLEGGLRLLRLMAAIPFGAVAGGLACHRLDYRIPAVAGLVLAAVGFWFMGHWGLDVSDPWMTVHLATTGLGFGLLIAPIALAATNSVVVGDRGAAAATVTAMRLVGMTFGLSALTAWGVGRFQGAVGGMQLPLRAAGETVEQWERRVVEFESGLIDAGLGLFNDFFLVAMGVCLIAVLPAALMFSNRPVRRAP